MFANKIYKDVLRYILHLSHKLLLFQIEKSNIVCFHSSLWYNIYRKNKTRLKELVKYIQPSLFCINE